MLSKSMALFWTFAEGLIFLYMRSGFLFLKGRKSGQKKMAVLSIVAFMVLSAVMLFGEGIAVSVFELHARHDRYLYRWALWNFFCTLWVILEGAIMVYVFRIYRTLKSILPDDAARPYQSQRDISFPYIGVPVLVLSLLLLYIFYQHHLILTVSQHNLTMKHIYRISLFYIRVCGVFWIAFEWAVAVMGIKTYTLLKGDLN